MPALAKIQRDFCDTVRGHGHQNFLHHIKATTLPKETLVRVYLHNIYSTHLRSLQNDYPIVFALLGDTARPLVRAYVEVNLPCTGSLADWGAGFTTFLHQSKATATHPYLTDIARYEWAKHIAYGAAENPLPTAEDLKEWAALQKNDLTFLFQDSCQLIAFSHAIEQIISTHEEGKKNLSLESQGASYALILKHQGTLKTYWLTPSLFAFLNRLKEGQDAEVALAAAQILDPEFDAQAAFVFLLSHPILHR